MAKKKGKVSRLKNVVKKRVRAESHILSVEHPTIVRGSARIEREGRDRRKKGRREPENRPL